MPVLTLTTDIGQNDYIIGAIKGQLLSVQPLFNIVDITHHLSPFNYIQAAYICNNAFKYFPSNTYHIILVNLFELELHHLLMAKYNNQFIICPDNGILTMITNHKPDEIFALNTENGKTTLDYTYCIAAALGELNNGKEIEQIGVPITTIEEKYPLRATIGPDWMEGQIIFIDRFENVVVNITQEEFEEQRKSRSFQIVFTRNEEISHISSNYGAALPGEKLAWFNSAGYLEIAINKGNVAGLFGLQGFNENAQDQSMAVQNKWFYQTVRIFFK